MAFDKENNKLIRQNVLSFVKSAFSSFLKRMIFVIFHYLKSFSYCSNLEKMEKIESSNTS